MVVAIADFFDKMIRQGINNFDQFGNASAVDV